MSRPDLAQAARLLAPETIENVRCEPFNAYGWAVLERWADHSPAALLDLERKGLVVFLNRVLDQQAAELAALTDAPDDVAGLSRYEALRLAGVEPDLSV